MAPGCTSPISISNELSSIPIDPHAQLWLVQFQSGIGVDDSTETFRSFDEVVRVSCKLNNIGPTENEIDIGSATGAKVKRSPVSHA